MRFLDRFPFVPLVSKEVDKVDEKPFLTTKEAAKLLGMPLRTVQSLCKRGEIKALKIGKRYRILRENLIGGTWIETKSAHQ